MSEWRRNINIKRACENEIRAEFRVEKESPWFSGHFPGDPVLPGIAQLAAVCDAVKAIEGERERLTVSRVRRVRFKRIVRPGDCAELILKRDSNDRYSYSFKIMVKDEVACSGFIVAAEKEKEI